MISVCTEAMDLGTTPLPHEILAPEGTMPLDYLPRAGFLLPLGWDGQDYCVQECLKQGNHRFEGMILQISGLVLLPKIAEP